jgi:hypothetical protein
MNASKRPVTERDVRMPQFQDADLADLEFREDGQVVRKDRWEMALRRIKFVVGDNRREFDVLDVVAAVEWLVTLIPNQAAGNVDDDCEVEP